MRIDLTFATVLKFVFMQHCHSAKVYLRALVNLCYVTCERREFYFLLVGIRHADTHP
jgi:hypothetical protein